jgi:putative IMPACT (imprinted ancient) family translation regulator
VEIFSFRTIQSYSEGSYKESGSKFLAFAYPVSSEEEIKSKIEGLKKKYFDATHHCFAWVLGADKSKFRAMDDGEPNH